jgi:hypothetical protein
MRRSGGQWQTAGLLALCVLTATASGPLARAAVPDVSAVECSSAEFTAEYFDNIDLSGRAFLVECHDRIDFDWGRGRPHPRVPEDHFGVRWSGEFTLSQGTYRFAASTDDGTRVYLDGERIIDAWYPRAVRQTAAYGHVAAGTHSLVVEYFEEAGHAVAQVEWERSTSGWFQVEAEAQPREPGGG